MRRPLPRTALGLLGVRGPAAAADVFATGVGLLVLYWQSGAWWRAPRVLPIAIPMVIGGLVALARGLAAGKIVGPAHEHHRRVPRRRR